MTVYIIYTSNVDSELVTELQTLLVEGKTGITFNLLNPVELNSFEANVINKKKSTTPKISFAKLFEICLTYREYYGLNEDAFIILLSGYTNEKNWFSAVSKRNIFIDINGWEEITQKEALFGIAFQVYENIFQSLLDINWDNTSNNKKYIHEKSRGCINDFCKNKEEIILKLKTVDTCDVCGAYAIQKINLVTLNAINTGLESLRPNFKSLNKILGNSPETIIISNDYKTISVGNIKLKLQPLEKTILIFFLINNTLSKMKFSERESDLKKIYKKVPPGGDASRITKLFHDGRTTDYFRKIKSTLNSKLTRQIGRPLCDHYLIVSDKTRYMICVKPTFITLPTFP
jgi:hypothetical protein